MHLAAHYCWALLAFQQITMLSAALLRAADLEPGAAGADQVRQRGVYLLVPAETQAAYSSSPGDSPRVTARCGARHAGASVWGIRRTAVRRDRAPDLLGQGDPVRRLTGSMGDDVGVTLRRVVPVVTGLALLVFAMLFFLLRRDDASWLATFVSTLAAIAGLGITVHAVAVAQPGTSVRVSRTGRAKSAQGGRAISGFVGPASSTSGRVEVGRTGDAEASGGDAVSGAELI